MRTSLHLAACLLLLTFTPLFGQQSPAPAQAPALTTFNLDFPGGTPADLVAAIEKATGKPLNAIIPTEDANVQLPPMKMTDVDVVRLFAALGAASDREVRLRDNEDIDTSYGFSAEPAGNSGSSGLQPGFPRDRFNGNSNPSNGAASDDTIWYFHAVRAQPSAPKICVFFSLAPYLDHGLTVDDITTAIRTGWEMQANGADDMSRPELSFHKETKLLIAVGDQQQMSTMGQMLNALAGNNSDANDTYADDLKRKNQRLQAQIDALNSKQVDDSVLKRKIDVLEGELNALTSKMKPALPPSAPSATPGQ